MKEHHYQELKQSAISDDVIQLNFRSAEGYEGFTKFISLCESKDKRQGRQILDNYTNKRYSHLCEGYWYANSWEPLTDTLNLTQVKPDVPLLQLVTTQGVVSEDYDTPNTPKSPTEPKYQQPVSLNHRPDKRYLPQKRGYLWGTRQTIISIAQALKITDKLPMNEQGKWHLEAISAMSPLQKYLWCLENKAFDFLAFTPIKYETPTGSGTPFIYLNIPLRVLEEIATKYQLTLPSSYQRWGVSEKWHWIKAHPQIPLFITEGIKKAASLISHGKIAIASFSITTHSEKISEGQSSWHTNLKPELLWLLEKKCERLIYLVFDAADIKETSRQAVQRETKKIGKKLRKYGQVKIITWQDQSCKGIDDFIAKHGIDGLNEIINKATNFDQIWSKELANYGRKLTPDIQINQRYLSANLINQARLNGIKLLCIKSPQNTGKSSSYSQSLKEYTKFIENLELENPNSECQPENLSLPKTYALGENVKIQVGSDIYESKILGYNVETKKYQCQFSEGFIERDLSKIIHSLNKIIPKKLKTYGLTNRQSLAWNLAQKFALDCYLSNVVSFDSQGIMVCADSSLMISEFQEFNDMIIDESEQVAWHLLASLTDIRKNRITKIERIAHHGKEVIKQNGMITIMDADLSDIGVKFYQDLFGINQKDTLVVENLSRPFQDIRSCFIYRNIESLRHRIIQAIKGGERIIIHTSGQKESSTHGTINIEKEILQVFPELESKIYRIDKESLGDCNHLSYQILSNLERLKTAQIIIASSCINTGVSLDENIVGTFDSVFGIFYGNYPLTDFEQAIERYRGNCPRYIYIKNASSERLNIGSYKYTELLENILGQTNNIHLLLKDNFNCDLAMDLVKFYCQFASRINNDYMNLKNNFICHLKDKGYTLYDTETLEPKYTKELKAIHQSIREQSEKDFQDKVFEAKIPSPERLEKLEKSRSKTKKETIEEYKGQLASRYKTNQITKELIFLDREGLYPQLLLRFWLSLGTNSVIKRDQRVLTRYTQNNDSKGYAVDFNRQSYSTQIFLLTHIGIAPILEKLLKIEIEQFIILLLSLEFNPLWFKLVNIKKLNGLITESDIIPYLSFREDKAVIRAFKQVLNIDLTKNQSPIQLLRMILERIGYRLNKAGRLGSRNERKRYYRITDCISNELENEIFNNWLEHELGENASFENELREVA